ncbi:serine/threonine-protein kinase AFC3-like isoform X2 [Juglans microcarpa x Juglans regia]|uniref:serine/threonine-protein kinase AFC3-like isoform X2 n=1 Tax=Juglans microcarpa x Juglans regia TaxID=2249226 RepID=UPI001B7E4847|nr:serine/threonine-protein kinase AFC3-like isoform X2 [Juglans microcarpa x Juglans regia]
MVAIGIEGMEREQRIRKRPRLTWDVAPSEPQVKRAQVVSNEGVNRRRHASPPRRDDDREGHYVFNLGENLTPRYKILCKIGEGTFGRVLECWDRQTREYVAIKVVRSIRKYRDAAMIEVDVLQHLAKNDKGNSHCVQIRNWFDYRNHICIVFEKLGPSLFDFLKRNKYCPFPVDLVREFGRQLLESVAYMHDLHLIHTDLKPENILLVSSEHIKLPGCKLAMVQRFSSDEMQFRCLPKSSAIKLIDFGSTAFDNQNHSSIVSTRHYRAPEVILGLGWSYPCDLWSVGCILIELCSGGALFQTHENLEHLAMMERVLGPLPEHMVKRADRGAEKYFRRGSRLNWPEGAVSRESIRAVNKLYCLKDLVSQHVVSSRSSLTDLLQGLLKYDPSERLTARQALSHPFFQNQTLRE